jgi:TRAP-type C4-dicarboxylate transport system substrate-binding protein
MFGELDMFSSNLTDYLPLMIDEVSGLATPFLLPGEAPTRKYLASKLLDEARDKVLVSRHIRYLEMSAMREPSHVIAARRPIAAPGDLAGLKLTSTTPLTKGAVRLWEALGANYVPTAPGADLGAAFKSGQVDALIAPDLQYVTSGALARAAPYVVGVDDCPQIWQISINDALWKGLSEDEQAALLQAAKDSAAIYQAQSSARFRQETRRLLARTGRRFVQLDASALRARLVDTYPALVADGQLNPAVLAAANSAVAASP